MIGQARAGKVTSHKHMLTDFKLPDLGENIKSGLITKVMIAAGDVVKKDQPILELETDKAVLEVPCSLAGTVKEVLVKAGQEVKVGEVIFRIDTAPVSGGPPKEDATVSPKDKEGAGPQRTPTPSPKPETPSPQEASPPQSTPESAAGLTGPLGPAPMVPSGQAQDIAAAPSVRRFAREIGIDIAQVPGSGPGGRISLEDVKAYAKALNTTHVTAKVGAGRDLPLPDFSKWGPVERRAMNMVRRKTSEHLSFAWNNIPHVTQIDKTDITELDKLRKRFEKKVEAAGGKLTVTAFLLKVVASALKVFPQFNASVDVAKNEVIYKKYCHIGVAVDTDRGLLVPVVRDVDQKSILEIAVALTDIAERARTKKTTVEEMQGGTFTMTNLGSIGGTGFTPIVNWPEVAILGVARAGLEPVFVKEQFVARLMLPLCLSYDHRLIDGADGARFLRWIAKAIQQPFLMELEGR